VVQADGQNVEPVPVDEFRIGVAETYDVIVEPREDRAYTVFAEAMDRSGYARGTLAPRAGMSAPVPERRPIPERGMAAMGHDMMGHGAGTMETSGGGSHAAMGHEMPGMDDADAVSHGPHDHGPGAAMVAPNPRSRLDEPGVGLESSGRRALVYGDLRALGPWPDRRAPAREIELHLTGNMERYMWSFDGKKFTEVDAPIRFRHGERLRLTMVNDTMMDHPIHLHGMWMELDNGAEYKPRKHTISVKPGEKLSVEITADAPGDWAFHCHLLYHMKAGMFRVVSVVRDSKEA
ncbi:MAG: multicopper oxidase domain-containing protein, partial [Gammaproteobacteria bacterium]|nr:multicopper oxidase domain-containing protein [Gammaproteobacteria bacterium]